MFAALLIVCSMNSNNCAPVHMPPVFMTEKACEEWASGFVATHALDLKRGFGRYETVVWCRKYEGQPA